MAKEFEASTKGVRAGIARTEFQEHSEALFLTSSFVFKSAKQAAAIVGGTWDSPPRKAGRCGWPRKRCALRRRSSWATSFSPAWTSCP